ncbi:ABC transporter ATP-binding protein [Azospirillum baldaniorum]|uniref:ABC transporter, ATP-binding protein putative dipeptide/oligopeptide/nickel transporter n=1 Tax=Azospirillum baldaniorum TaxID=1064539 RepID=A0A9P1JNC6_9PROT|nr:ABC transporter ATP-binding protein [Azospirillum baldaniorum]AWJ88441.1 ABC transporter ATP-binding protein [Azospirillum baldaniorum]TWA80044.1 peptide/nickel transport system ATP-binding protein [Azospirillum brasilense]CCC96643.1 ABC transporter, ATP-binding protein; putative dipeptide/oligopeptide/nickel transporter [Azospirillum baldaniorum]
MSRTLLRVEDLKVDFQVPGGVVHAVRGVSFRVRAGSTVALVGESGSGKSVAAQSILRILPRNATIADGQILFDDGIINEGVGPVDIAGLKADGTAMRALRGGRISIIFQEPMTSLSPLHTVGDQVGEAVRLHQRVTARQARAQAEDMLRRVRFPDPKRALDTYPFELSGGLRQRAMIAMALVCRPALLIADEPTTALDVTIQAQILKLIKDLQADLGMAVLLITHDLGVVANLADEVVVMHRGRIMESGTREDIFADPRHPYLKALLRAVPRFHMAPGERLVPIRSISIGGTSQGGSLLEKDHQPWPPGADTAGPLLAVEGVRKRYGARKAGWFGAKAGAGTLAVDDVSFAIARGECVGLVGESGCGKTTLSKILMRALTPDAGDVRFNDHGRVVDVLGLEGAALTAFRRKVQFVFQDPFGSLNPRMTVFDIIEEPLVIHGIGDEAERAARVKELMGLVGLDARHLRRYPHSFSGGQRQRIGIARALALRPELLLLDEPVSALDVSIQAQVLNLLKDLKERLGLTYLFVSHNLAVVDYMADRILVMCRGRIVESAPREALFRNPVHPYTRALLAAVPEPDPSRPLSLTDLEEGRASDPARWPAPFTIDDDHQPHLVDLGGGHCVRADAAIRVREVA